MSNIKGICFENGMFCVGNILTVCNENHDMVVKGVLQLIIGQNEQQQRYTTFQHLNPFVDETNFDTLTNINRNKIVFVFELEEAIIKAYESSLSKIIVPESQGIIMPQ